MRGCDLRRVEGLARGSQVAAWLRVIDGGKTGLTETGRVLNDLIALAVAFVILIGARVQRLINWVRATDFNHRTVTDRRLRRRDGCLLLTIIT
ncbi:hypothetical protein D3C81_1734970 [compost metagenome]